MRVADLNALNIVDHQIAFLRRKIKGLEAERAVVVQRIDELDRARAALAKPVEPKPVEPVPVEPEPESKVLLPIVAPGGTAKDQMVYVLTKLAERDPHFLALLSKHPKCWGKSRHYVSCDRQTLYADRPDLAKKCSSELPGGWFVATNLSNRDKIRLLSLASSLSPEREIRIQFKA
jgi:hypothetical protein